MYPFPNEIVLALNRVLRDKRKYNERLEALIDARERENAAVARLQPLDLPPATWDPNTKTWS